MMDAVVCHGPEEYSVEEIEVPARSSGELLIEVGAVGICASDLKCYHGAAKFWGDATRAAWAEREVVPGHEFAGVVVELDDEARRRWGVELGDHVTSEQIVPCWKCRYCRRGEYWMCAVHNLYGFKRATPGAMARYMVFPQSAFVYRVNREVPFWHAAFAEPLSCSLHAVERAGISFEDVVVVAGCGPIGLGMVIGAAAKGAEHVVALDTVGWKLELAKKCGATDIVDLSSDGARGLVDELTEGYGADVYLEATGNPLAVSQGLDLLRKRGRFVEYSVFKEPSSVDWSIISDDKELDVLGAHLGPHCWEAAIRMIESGRLPLDDICTHQLPLAQFKEGLEMVDRSQESVKVSLIPERTS